MGKQIYMKNAPKPKVHNRKSEIADLLTASWHACVLPALVQHEVWTCPECNKTYINENGSLHNNTQRDRYLNYRLMEEYE